MLLPYSSTLGIYVATVEHLRTILDGMKTAVTAIHDSLRRLFLLCQSH